MNKLVSGKKASFKVQNMSCSSCSSNIEKKLRATEGVLYVAINFGAEKAQVEFDGEKVSVEALLQVIEKLRYKSNTR